MAYRRAEKVWAYWANEVWPLVNNLEMESKEAKATALEKKAQQFIQLWIAAAMGETKHLYPHLLIAHLPDQIRNLPVDPWYLQTQALEHKHKIRKQMAFLSNKHAPKPSEDRKTTTAGYFTQSGTWKKGKTDKGTGPCRNYQMMGKSIVRDALQSSQETKESVALKWERSKSQRDHVNQRKTSDLLATHTAGQRTFGEILTRRSADLFVANQMADIVDMDGVSDDEDGDERGLVDVDFELSSDDELECLP
jgi:hypothetical protein